MRDARWGRRDARCGMRGFPVILPSRIPHPPSRKNRLSRQAELGVVLFREGSFSEPNVEPRAASGRPELDDSGRSAIDHIHQRLQRFPFPVRRFPVVRCRYRDDEPLRLHAARQIRLDRLPNA